MGLLSPICFSTTTMKKIFLLILLPLFTLCLTANGQILKQHKQVLLDGSVLRYTSQYGLISGLFKVNQAQEKEDLIRGNYVEGKQKGNWYFFNFDNSLFLRYNYDSRKVLFIDTKKLAMFKLNVLSEDENIRKGASVPIPLWSLDSFYVIATESAKEVINGNDRRQLLNKQFDIKVQIDANGKPKYFVMYSIGAKKTEREFLVNMGYAALDWLPSSFKDVTYPSEVVFSTKFISLESVEDEGHRRFNWGE
jgi:hypothetical protein